MTDKEKRGKGSVKGHETERDRLKEEHRRRRRKNKYIFAVCQGLIVIMALLLFLNIRSEIRSLPEQAKVQEVYQPKEKEKVTVSQNEAQNSGSAILDYVSYCGLDQVEKPKKRTPEEVITKLYELAEENKVIGEILNKSEQYPDNLLEALANNPEMADFAAGYQDASKEAEGGLTEVEFSQEYPLFLQWDPRWGYVSYGDDSNIGLAGCGPTSLAMALYYLTKDETLTPDAVAEYSTENGYYMKGSGTAWALMEALPKEYGIKVGYPGIGESRMKAALDAGSILICAMKPGDFTAAGHFIVIYGYDEAGFFVNDPNCVARSRRSWTFEELRRQIKNLWSFSAPDRIVK